MSRKRTQIVVYGNVQGVSYRVSARTIARRLNLTGLALNQENGTVLIEVEGDRKDIETFINWCKEGPAQAQVESIQIKERGTLANYSDFSIG